MVLKYWNKYVCPYSFRSFMPRWKYTTKWILVWHSVVTTVSTGLSEDSPARWWCRPPPTDRATWDIDSTVWTALLLSPVLYNMRESERESEKQMINDVLTRRWSIMPAAVEGRNNSSLFFEASFREAWLSPSAPLPPPDPQPPPTSTDTYRYYSLFRCRYILICE